MIWNKRCGAAARSWGLQLGSETQARLLDYVALAAQME